MASTVKSLKEVANTPLQLKKKDKRGKYVFWK